MAAPQEKKGLGKIAWVLIGCLGIVVVGAGVLTVGTIWLGKKVVETVSEPIKLAELAVQAHPEFDLIDSDAEKGMLRVRRVDTNEVITVTLDDVLKKGLVIESDSGGRLELNPGGGEDGAVVTTTTAAGETASMTVDAGGATIKGADGQTTRLGGSIDGQQLPSWFPEFEGDTLTPTMVSSQPGGQSGGMVTVSSIDAPAEFRERLERQLVRDGFERIALTEVGGRVGLQYERDGRTLNISIQLADGGGTEAAVVFAGPAD